MCGRFSLGTPAKILAAQFDLFEVPPWTPRYNIAPTQEVLAVVKMPEAPGRQARLLRWGLVPSWADNARIGNRLINARGETVATKLAFRRAFQERRCLVLADGFYEWQRQDHRKQPSYIRLRDGRPFSFAGLWERWVHPDGQPIDSCTILTTAANDLVRPLHLRMPVILSPADYDVWLDPSVREAEPLQPLLRPYPPEEMEAYAVSTRVNNPANDTLECIKPFPGQSLTTN